MASESLIVLTGFCLLNIAFILNTVGLASTHWIEGYQYNSTNNDSSPLRNGLWQTCTEEECSPLAGPKPGWLLAVQIVFTMGAVMALLTVLLEYLFCMTTRGRQSKPLHGLLTFCSFVTWILLLTGVALYGSKFEESFLNVAPPRTLGWSYIVAACGTTLSFLASLFLSREMCILAGKTRAYIDL